MRKADAAECSANVFLKEPEILPISPRSGAKAQNRCSVQINQRVTCHSSRHFYKSFALNSGSGLSSVIIFTENNHPLLKNGIKIDIKRGKNNNKFSLVQRFLTQVSTTVSFLPF